MEIARGVYFYRGRAGDRIRPGAGSCNVVAIRGDSLLFVDSGLRTGGAFEELRQRASADGLSLETLGWIVHTHGHWDHINADGALLALSGARVAAGREDVPLVEDPEESFRVFSAGLGDLVREVFPYPQILARLLIRWVFGKQPAIRVDRALEDGEVIDPGTGLTAVGLPGHTRGHTGYFLPAEGVLVSGDLFDFENAHGMDINNPRSDYRAALASLEKALRLGPEIVVPGHGAPVRGVRPVRRILEKARAAGLRYPEQILTALGGKAVRLRELTYRAFPDTRAAMESMNKMLVLTVLACLEEEGRVVRERDRDGRAGWAARTAG